VVADYAKYKSKIEELGATVTLVTGESGTGAINFQSYRDITGYQGLIYVDSEYAVYNALGCKPKGSALKGVSSSLFGKGSGKFLKSANLEGNIDQQGGQFIILPDGTLIYRFQESHAAEFKDYEGIVRVLGEMKK